MSQIRSTKSCPKPQWVVLSEQLVIQAHRDIQRQRRRIAKEKLREHELFNLEARAHVR